MEFDYKEWTERHDRCVVLVNRLCDLDTKSDVNKCASALCVMSHAMQDIKSYFEDNDKSTAELCFLIRNVDVAITCILDLNNLLLKIGTNKQDKALEKCFVNCKIVHDFRTLRSLILAHPVDTNYINDNGEKETIYLEDILPARPVDVLLGLEGHDYTLRMCHPNTQFSHFKPLKISEEIVPVINEIIDGILKLSQRLQDSISQYENNLRDEKLIIDQSNMESYIVSLDKELQQRYPSCVHDTTFFDGSVRHYSIVYDCLMYVKASYSGETQNKFNIFLQYIKDELRRIENDLQSMTYDTSEESYFVLFNNPDFANREHYAKEKMFYLHDSDATSFTSKEMPRSPVSDAFCGIQQFKILIPYIEKYLPVDTAVSDKELYCEYIAANYLSNISERKES